MPYPSTTLYPQTSDLYPGGESESGFNLWPSAGDLWPGTDLFPSAVDLQLLPTVVTGGSSGMDTDSALVAGTINPNGLAAHYYFEYSTVPRFYESGTSPIFYGSQSSEGSAGHGAIDVSVSSTLTGLASGRTYYYTLVAFNGTGYAYGDEESFDTLVDDLGEFLAEFVHTADRGQ